MFRLKMTRRANPTFEVNQKIDLDRVKGKTYYYETSNGCLYPRSSWNIATETENFLEVKGTVVCSVVASRGSREIIQEMVHFVEVSLCWNEHTYGPYYFKSHEIE